MGIRVPSTLATRKAIYEVDDVDLIRANTDNTWPIVARYMSDLGLSKGNILLDLGANANLTMSMPYHFDIGPNVFWLARDINGQVNQLDFIGGFPSPANTAIVTNTWGTGSFTANVRITQPDSNLDIFAVNVYSNSDLVANTGTIRKTSRGNFDLVFYTSQITSNEYQTDRSRDIHIRVPYAVRISAVAIGSGGGGGAYSYSTGASGAGLGYRNNWLVAANSNIIITVGKAGGKGYNYASPSYEGFPGGESAVFVIGAGTICRGGGGAGGRDGDTTIATRSGPSFGTPAGQNPPYVYEYVTQRGPTTGSYAGTGGGPGGYAGDSFFKIQGSPQSPAFQGGNGGGAGGYAYSDTLGLTSGKFAYTDSTVTQYDTFNTNFWLSTGGGGAGGLARVSSVADSTSYSGYGTGIYGWNGYNQRNDWTNNYNVGVTYPKTVGLPEEKKYGGYGATINGSMDPLFATTTPSFGYGGGIGQDGGPGVVRIMFDGDKRQFPSTSCGLEPQTASWVWKDGAVSFYNGTVTDPDNLYPNVLSWITAVDIQLN